MKKFNLYHLAIGVALLLNACNQVSQSFRDTFNGRPRKSRFDAMMSGDVREEGSNFLTDAQRLAKAENELRNLPELKGKPVKLYGDMHMYDDGRIMLAVQDPDTLENVNAYTYSRSGEWSPRQPVQLSGNMTGAMISSSAIPLENLRFKTVAQMAKLYADSAKRVGSSSVIDHIYYVPDVQEWYCNDMSAPRASYEIYFNPDGTVKEFRKE